jgi:hypothetical protein
VVYDRQRLDDLDSDRELFTYLAVERRYRFLRIGHLATRELPGTGEVLPLLAALHQPLSLPAD